ncbi:hypothetical protein EJ110_NYTH00941 [Nymphaea thermarum]|nr:hypothetical protein EJ110_NYTH00941 [Nymphaea thermarum]
MGCSGSKVDDLPVVSLCRERTRSIEEAVQQRYLLSAAHLSYIRSLREVGAALEAFLDSDHVSPGASPVLPLPPHRKTDPAPLPKPKSPSVSAPQSGGGGGSHGRSDSGHLQFDSDSDESLSDDHDHDHDHDHENEHDHHHNRESQPPPGMFQEPNMMDAYGGYPSPYTVMNQYFMRSRPPQSITYEERPQLPAKVNQYYMPSTSAPSVAYSEGPDSPEKVKHYLMRSTPMQSVAYEEQLQSAEKVSQYFMRSKPMQSVAYEGRPQSPEVQWGQSYPYYSNNFGFPVFFGGAGGTSSSSPPKAPPPAYPAQGASSSSYPYEENRPPPPPPPPAKSSTWDFLNPFYSYEGFYPPYTPRRYSDGGSRDSREVREEEGIPELEEDSQSEVVKEIHGEKKFSDGFTGHPGWYRQKNVQFQAEDSVLQDEEMGGGDQSAYQGKPTAVSEFREDDGTEMVDKNVIENDEPVERTNAAEFPRSYDAFEAMKHIKAQFDKAAEAGNQVSAILEVGKLPYRHRNAVHKASVRMLGAIAPPLILSSQPSTSKSRTAELPSSAEESSPALLDFEDVTWLRTRKLSTTLEKLYMWEKKLFEEVKAEEKLRVIQERKRRQLRRMNERGSEAHKVERTRTLIRNLSTKIRIAIHFVDSVSTKINKLRDEELWPQIVELLQGLVTMWKTMLECHRNQCRIISEAKNIDFIADGAISSDSHMRVTVRLELEMLNWISSFYVWIATQKGYIKALNSWLLKCIHYEPEETPDGPVPFSPGRVGAPPVFVVCNRWSQAIDDISEKEVIAAMHKFSVLVLQQWQRHSAAQRSRLVSRYSPKDVERGIKALQKDEQKIQKAWDALYKKPVFPPVEGGLSSVNQIVQQSHPAPLGGLKASLKQIFDAMAKFAETSLKAYEELDLNTELDRITREREKVS